MPLLRNHAPSFVDKRPSELYSHVDEDEDGHWDQSPSGQDKFSPKAGSALLCQHVSHKSLLDAMTGEQTPSSETGGESPSPSASFSKLNPYTTSPRSMKGMNPSFRRSDSRGSDSVYRSAVSRANSFSPKKTRVMYDYTPGPGAYSPAADRKGRKQGPGGAAVSWRIGTEGSKRKIGRGTAIDKVAKHNSFQGVMPANPTHQDITSDSPGAGQRIHVGYMSPGPIYRMPEEKVATALFSKSQRAKPPKPQYESAVGSYTPSTVRTGDPVPFSEKKKNERGYSFGTADRVQPKEYISRRHEKILLSKDSQGPAHYDTLRLTLLYGTPPGPKKRIAQPKDGTLDRPSTSPGMKPSGPTMWDAVEKRGRSYPGPGDYKVNKEAVYPSRIGVTIGTSYKAETPAAGWNPTRSEKLITRSNFTPQFISKMHALGLVGSFSPGPAMYSPGNADLGWKKSEKMGTVFGTGHRFNPAYSGGLTDPVNPTLLRRDDDDSPLAPKDSNESMPMSTTAWSGARVGAQELGRRSMASRSNSRSPSKSPSRLPRKESSPQES